MADIANSALTQRIIDRAESIREESKGDYLIPEHILAAVLEVMLDQSGANGTSPEEGRRVMRLFDKFSVPAPQVKAAMIDSARGKKSTLSESFQWQKIIISARNMARTQNREELTADILLECIINQPTGAISGLLKEGQKPTPAPAVLADPARDAAQEAQQDRSASATQSAKRQSGPATAVPQNTLADLIERTRTVQAALNQKVFGQSHAVAAFVSGYFQSALFSITDKERTRPMATFLFAGPPGVGKTFLAEQAAKAIDLPFRRFDMSEYSNAVTADQLTGSDKTIMNSSEGLLTGFVAHNPRCIILFDEIEKAHESAIYLFLQVLDAGVLRDNRTDKEVPFKDAILIFTTNAGRNLYEADDSTNLSALPRKVILSALRKDVNPKTGEPWFPAAICSRFASGNVVMFNHVDAYNLQHIVRKQLEKHASELEQTMNVKVDMDERLYSILMMAEGASADARTVKQRADAFWGQELFELFRLAGSEHYAARLDGIRRIRVILNLPEDAGEIRELLTPSQLPEAIVRSELIGAESQGTRSLCALNFVNDFEQAEAVFKKKDAQLFLCDAPTENANGFLNREDVDSASRSFLLSVLSRFGDMPIYLLEDDDAPLFDEERDSYLKRGVRGFMRVKRGDPDSLCEGLREAVNKAAQQWAMNELARANKVLTFETAQRLSEDGEAAEIVLFDFRLQVAVDAGDSKNLLSAVSRPDVRFDQVIGAEDAKKELQYFMSYLKNPKRFMGTGVSAPKGVILYGPPGTGKTMLAKAMAGESGITFIAAEGNQFLKKYVGEGEESVHRLFAMARKYAPAILFIDEIDAIAKARTGSEFSHSSESILTAFLAEMDGFSGDARKPVFVLAATNYNADTNGRTGLDPALLRRFDRRIFVELPDKADRMRFLRERTSANPIFKVSEAALAALAERSTGMSLAQLASVLELALRDYVREGKESVDDAAMEEAYETFNGGMRREWDASQTLRTARHEAGHAFISWMGGETPSYITIISRGDHGGYMQHQDQEDKLVYTRRDLLNLIRTALGGRASELVYYGPEEGLSSGASGDLRQATRTAAQILCAFGMDGAFGMASVDPSPADEGLRGALRIEVNRILEQELQAAVKLIGDNRRAVDALVERLLAEDHLNGEAIDAIFSANAKRACE